MAAISTSPGVITAHPITTQNHISPKTNYLISVSISRSCTTHYDAKSKRHERLIAIKNSGDENAESATETEPEVPVEVPTGQPSLISTLNVEKALRGIAITDVDHYGRLGLRTGCSYDQVSIAYKNKVEELMNKGLDEEVSKELELLKESHSILSTPEERRMYDWSLARTGKADDIYVWPFEVDITQSITGTPPPQEPEDEGPTRLVGYFFLGWLILSFVLFIAFNTYGNG